MTKSGNSFEARRSWKRILLVWNRRSQGLGERRRAVRDKEESKEVDWLESIGIQEKPDEFTFSLPLAEAVQRLFVTRLRDIFLR